MLILSLFIASVYFLRLQIHKRSPTTSIGSLNDFHVGWRIICFDVRINGFFDHPLLQLGFRKLTPDSRFIAAFSKLICAIQVSNMFNQDLASQFPNEGYSKMILTITIVTKFKQSGFYCFSLPQQSVLPILIGQCIYWFMRRHYIL